MKKFKVTINVDLPAELMLYAETADEACDIAENIVHQRFMETRLIEAEETSETD